MDAKIGKLEAVPLRELWKHEERGFSAWLEHNLEALGDRLGLRISPLEREKDVGPFHVDLLAEDEDHNRVVIENQLEQTDHKHLGQILTYLVNLEASAAIWITSDPRAEHERAIEWLNESSPAAIYLVKLEAYRIGSSDPAPLFTVVAGPNAATKAVGREKKDWADRHIRRHKFWSQLLERAKAITSVHASRSPCRDQSLSAGAGRAGISFVYYIKMNEGAVFVSVGSDDPAENKRMFDYFRGHKDQIEKEFGAKLDWERMDGMKTSVIYFTAINKGLSADEKEWPEIQDAMIQRMDRLAKTFKPLIQSYKP
jgi:hypothetical protein